MTRHKLAATGYTPPTCPTCNTAHPPHLRHCETCGRPSAWISESTDGLCLKCKAVAK